MRVEVVGWRRGADKCTEESQVAGPGGVAAGEGWVRRALLTTVEGKPRDVTATEDVSLALSGWDARSHTGCHLIAVVEDG